MKEVMITSSVLIGVIMLLRWLLRGKVSQRLIYAAWLLVALRLLIPFQFGQFQFSLTALTEKIEANSEPLQQVQQILDEPVAGPSREELYDQLLNEYLQENPLPEAPVVPDEPVTVTPEVQQQLQQQVQTQIAFPTFADILTALWIVGMCGMAGWFVTANLLFVHRAKKDAIDVEFDGIPARISPNVPTPCVVGLLRPVIYLTPACAENEQMRAHVLSHEKAHLRHGDHLWALVRCLCLCTYWFNPLVWIAAGQSRRDCELACDETALKKLGDEERIAYGRTLLDVVSQSMSPVHLLETATAMNETKKQLTERVNYIVKKQKTVVIAAVCLIVVAAISTGCAFLGGSPREIAEAVVPIHGSVSRPGYKYVYLLTEVSNYYASGKLDIQYRYTYDQNGRLVTDVYHNAQDPHYDRTRTVSYNDRGLVDSISVESYKNSSSYDGSYDQYELVSYHGYTFDENGRLTAFEVTDDGDTTRTTFAYDSLGRLILRTKERPRLDEEYNHFLYDADGRLCKIVTPRATVTDLSDHTFTYDSQGRLIQFDATKYEYDTHGNMVKESCNGFDLIYTWENGVRTAIDCVPAEHFGEERTYTVDRFGNVSSITWEDGKRTELRYTRVELPDEYADRYLRQYHFAGPMEKLAVCCKEIADCFIPYGYPAIWTWEERY